MKRVINIGVDARFLALPNSGIGRYTANIVREYVSQQSHHRVFLYADRPFDLKFSLPEHWKVRTGTLRIRAFSSLFEQIYFPLWARKDRIDVFWSPINHLPIMMPSSIRKVLTVHDMVWKRFPQTMPWRGRIIEAVLMPRSLQIADQIIADSQFTRSEVRAFFPRTRSEIEVVHLASSLKADGPTGICPVSGRYFLFVGSKEPRKNLRRLLDAYNQYRKASGSPVQLVIAGTYQWGDFSIADYIATHNLQGLVHLVENADDSVLRALYANAFALVMVSLYEGFGLPLVEAMQWNIPLIASNNSAVAEVAGDAGLLVDPHETEGITEALRRVEEDSVLRSELGGKSKTRGQRFSWKEAAAQTMALIIGDLAVAD